MKRAVTIQDISCFGKCSVTVALPLISAMGVECAVIPTAVLSTHTGGFTGYTFRDLSDDIPAITDHWKKEGLTFDGVYTGYLGSPAQAQMIEDFIDDFSPSLVFVDPVMGDNGKLYAGFDQTIVDAMAKLCGKADIIVPNMTEAAFMLGETYRERGDYDMEYVRMILRKLTGLGAKTAALTGVMIDGKNQGVAAYDSVHDTFTEYFAPHLPLSCHGTGDVFSATMFGALLRDKTLYDSIRIAADNTCSCIKATDGDSNHWYGVKFEACIPALVRMLD
ncbi:MAG: pyridoxamine kinase [Clostridia bacterium]|nr:pyridoxamine kinase [Clostridia bacterium]